MKMSTELMQYNKLLREEIKRELNESESVEEQLIFVKILSAMVSAETRLMERSMLDSATLGEGDAVN